jgi:hypothetical protein
MEGMSGFTERRVRAGMERNTWGGTSYFVDIAWCLKANKIEGNIRTVSMEIRRKCTKYLLERIP